MAKDDVTVEATVDAPVEASAERTPCVCAAGYCQTCGATVEA